MTQSLKALELADRQAYLLLTTYEAARRKLQKGYRAFDTFSMDLTATPVWKAFRTVGEWLRAKGCFVRLSDVHWSGYVIYVFQHSAPNVPMPGQLRNDMLLRKYVSAIPQDVEHKHKTWGELGDLYNKILRPELRQAGIRRYLGLDVRALSDD